MNVEFNLKEDESISLELQRISESRFDLIDDNHKIWMELELFENNLKILSKSPDLINNEFIETKLEELFLKIIETERSGTDNYSEGDFLEQNLYDPEKIKVRTDKIPVTLIFQMINNNDIDLNPDFQRNLVWDNLQKSRLIESILLRIPLPMFYFAEDKDGKLSIVDGLQRISTIKEFMDNKFPLNKLQYLKETCGGRYYESKENKKGIDAKYFRWFNLTTLSANIIDPASPFKVKYDIFRRINTGGRPLNNQEIRNCLTGNAMRDVLKEMASLKEFKDATDNSIKSKRMGDREIALRFLLFYKMFEQNGNINAYNGYMDSSLDEFMEDNIKNKKNDYDKYIAKFSNAMKNAEYLIGRKYAFRKVLPKDIKPNAHKQLINKSLFVCTSILLANYDYEKIKKSNEKDSLLRQLSDKIYEDKELFNYLSWGTNGKANLIHTFKVLKDLFDKQIKD
jgi:hypothetical protein